MSAAHRRPGRGGPRVVVLGAGFGGLGVAKALRDVGVEDVTILERADSVGGVWRDNTYPGAACDVPSPLYSWSWAQNPHWARRYAQQPEILDYLRRTAAEHGLVDLVRTGTDVVSAVLDEASATWQVTARDGSTYEADLVVSAVGQLSNPAVPSLPGSFAGPAFHSAQWRHDVDLRGKRVAVIGTGASAIQFVPAIVDEVKSLTVFQRSAPYVVPKPDRGYTRLHHAAFEKVPAALGVERHGVFWLTERLNSALAGSRATVPTLAAIRQAWRLHLRRQVPDPRLRRRLVPTDPLGCKRLLFSNDWYPALARDHVEVVTEAVTGLEPDGVRAADGRLHEADVLIWGTGFAATRFLAGIDVRGSGGTDLHEVWADGARAHLGLTVPGFPNFFTIYGPNTNLGGSSIIGMLESQAAYVAQVARRIADGEARLVGVQPQAAQAYDEEMRTRLARSAWQGCDSWYQDGGVITTNWPGLVAEYQRRTSQVDWSELEVS